MIETLLRPRFSHGKEIVLFVALFAIAFAVQLSYVFPAGLTDETIWSTAAKDTAQLGLLRPPHTYDSHTLLGDPAYIYPGTTIILPAAVLDFFGVDEHVAIRGSFAFVIAFFVALACVALVLLRPRIRWLIPAASILILGPFYQGATLASAVVVPLIVLVVLSFLAIVESAARGRVPFYLLAGAGGIGGLAVATRLDVSLVVLSTGFILLLFTIGRRSWWVPLVALVTFIAFDPFLWSSPLHYMALMHAEAARQQSFSFVGAQQWAVEFVRPIPLATLSFVLYLCTLIFAPRALPVPARLATWLLAATVLMAIVILAAGSRRLWYFYAFFALWEVLLPLIISSLIEATPQQHSSPRAALMLEILCIGAVAVTYAWPVFL